MERRSAMTTPLGLARRHRDDLLAIAARYGVCNVRVLTIEAPAGESPAAGTSPAAASASPATSDTPAAVHLLVDVEPDRPGIEFFAFAVDAEDLLGTRVDIGTGYRPGVAVQIDRL